MADSLEQIVKLLVRLMELLPGFVKRVISETSFPADCSPGQLRVLFVLKEKKEMRMSEMARILLVTPGTLTAMVDRLCQCGFVQRYVDPADRRSIIVTLTPAGENILRLFREKLADNLAEFLAHIPLQERQELIKQLEGTIMLLNKYLVHTN